MTVASDASAVTPEASEADDPEVMEPSLVGLSFEATDLADPRWDPEAGDLDEVLGELGSPGLRFGGNALDRRVFWTSEGEEAPDTSYTVVTPDDLERVARMAEDLGSEVTLGIPLGDFDPERGADMAAHAVEAFGDRLIGLSIGNEPNGYTEDHREGLRIRDDSWDESKYVTQVTDYVEAIEAAVEPEDDVPIVGPGAFDGAWMDAFLDADLPGTVALTQHWYATYDCEATEIPGRGPEPENLVDPVVHDAATNLLGVGLGKAEDADLPLWVEESGSTSCIGDTAASRTHATALWTVDYVLHAAEMGVSRLGMHSMLGSCESGADMSVVCSDESDSVEGRVNHHALRLAAASVGGEFLETSVWDGAEHAAAENATPQMTGFGGMYAYAVRGADRVPDDALTVTVVNMNDSEEAGGSRTTIDVPEGYVAQEAAQVAGPSIEAVEETEYTDFGWLKGASASEGSTAGGSSGTDSSHESGVVSNVDGELVIDLAAATATTIVFERE
ncbi:hypothetical protein [Brevibacterium litoralis]|uniref:hypothetical protein n=1 Tax=Brevibacterium litoralis TaxID=3138935 RepID=UPI0032EFB69E